MVAALALTPLLAKDNEPVNRLDEAAAVFSEVMATPDKGIPQDLLDNAHCIVIVPDLKTAAFVFEDSGFRIWREIWERVPVLSKQKRHGLVRARHGPHRGRECWLSDRRLFDGFDHVGDE